MSYRRDLLSASDLDPEDEPLDDESESEEELVGAVLEDGEEDEDEDEDIEIDEDDEDDDGLCPHGFDLDEECPECDGDDDLDSDEAFDDEIEA